MATFMVNETNIKFVAKELVDAYDDYQRKVVKPNRDDFDTGTLWGKYIAYHNVMHIVGGFAPNDSAAYVLAWAREYAKD